MSRLGRLVQVRNLREQWPDEARDFTPWLAEDENLSLIGETLGFGEDWLEVIEIEANVGRFSADILCQDTSSDDRFVIIENQFGHTDHDHLGKLLTYAAGRKAKTLIWIAERIRDEHRAAIDLLNQATDDSFQFFALEIELWRIGESEVAPRLAVVAKPNNWSRATARESSMRQPTDLSDLKKAYVDYWTEFRSRLAEKTKLRAQKASPQQWIYIPIGRAGFTLTANVNSQKKWIQAQLELHGDEASAFFGELKKFKEEIALECPFPLNWDNPESRKGAGISIRLEGTDPTDRHDWHRQHEWLIDKIDRLHRLFRNRVKQLVVSEVEASVQ